MSSLSSSFNSLHSTGTGSIVSGYWGTMSFNPMWRRYGRIVIFYVAGTFYFSELPTENTFTTIITGMPSAYAVQGANIQCMTSDSSGLLVRVLANGEIAINKRGNSSLSSSVWVHMFGSYISGT